MVSPSEPETENGVDDDCDGNIDEGFSDMDGDGVTVEEGDCDDNNGWVSPNTYESCDGIDNDCDEIIDEDTPCVDTVIPPAEGNCGCSTTAPAGLWAVLPVGALLFRRRRGAQVRRRG